jgi:hypothetical protein
LRLEWTQEDEEIRRIRDEWRYECMNENKSDGDDSDTSHSEDGEEIKEGFRDRKNVV